LSHKDFERFFAILDADVVVNFRLGCKVASIYFIILP
jgi:hypothetical protein